MESCSLITIFLIITIFTFIILMLIARKKIIDNFSNITIKFANKEHVIDKINQNKIHYFKLLHKCKGINFHTRNIHDKQLIKHYTDSIMDFTDSEKEYIRTLVLKYLALIKNKGFPLDILSHWHFVKCKYIENNYPHTHDDLIFLPISLLNYAKHNEKSFMTTLFHEYCHVLQRKHEHVFKDLYTNYWPFHLADEVIGSDQLICNTRLNPDTKDLNYLFIDGVKYYYMTTLFNENANTLADVTHYFIEVVKVENNTFRIINPENKIKMRKNSNFMNYIGISNNNYNVNEISAELFSIYMMDIAENTKFNESFCYIKLKEWYTKYFK